MNGNYDLTYEGPEVQDILDAGNKLEADGFIFCGVATPSTNPGTPDQNVVYLASQAGTYTNFNGIELPDGISVLMWNGTWTSRIVYNNRIFIQSDDIRIVDYATIALKTIVVRSNSFNGVIYADEGHQEVVYDFGGGYRVLVLDKEGTIQTRTNISLTDEHDIILLYYSQVLSMFIGGYLLPTLNSFISSKEWKQVSEIPYTVKGNGIISSSTGNTGTSTYNQYTDYVDLQGVSKIEYLRLVLTSSSASYGMAFYDSEKTYISGIPAKTDGESISYIADVADVPVGAKFARFTLRQSISPRFYIRDVRSIEYRLSVLEGKSDISGKLVSVVGDSISCFGTEQQTRTEGYNAPYWIVKSVDVGNQIQSWITWLDVYSNVNNTTLIHKTIGGVEITPVMIGTKQTFTPILEDVGKEIGVSRWAGNYTEKPWWQILLDKTGAVLCNNASWSGSRMIPIPDGNVRHDAFVLSESYSEYTIDRVANRDDNGNIITPDVIIIARGINDFNANDPEGGTGDNEQESIEYPDLSDFSGITDTHNFVQAYIWAILKLREKYPQAYIYCCTLNQCSSRTFPAKNSQYTLPQYNEVIRRIANDMGCGIIQFDKDGITYENNYPTYISDSSTKPIHPNTAGHQLMGKRAVIDVDYI